MSLQKGMFIFSKPGKVKDHYTIERKPLGVGAFGSVCKGRHKKTHQQRAIKAISKAHMKNLEEFKREIEIMKMLDHPNIIKLYETFEDTRNVYLVMELCSGGELFDRILQAGSFSEVQAAILMQQIIRGIHYLHKHHICHRDLKPENFLFQTKDTIEQNNLKIIDFGLSCKFETGQVMKTKAGTPYYVAPQVLQGRYDQASDLWSCGVIMYVLLCGYPPFYGETDSDVLNKVRSGRFSFGSSCWRAVTQDAKDLIRELIKMDPKQRLTAEQALNHAWIKDKAPKADFNNLLQDGFVEHLRDFQSANYLKKAALHIIAGQLSEQQIKSLRETFVALDENEDGLLTVAEIRAGLTKTGLDEIPVDLQQIVAEVDADGNGLIDYTEFLAATLQKKLYIQEELCWKAFSIFDQNGDGQISREELKQVLNSGEIEDEVGTERIDLLMQEVDANGDGMIDFDEFMAMMQTHGSPCHQP
jgi:calcium-dependent protein kinase